MYNDIDDDFDDMVGRRTDAFANLIGVLSKVKEERLLEEGLAMLKVVRKSVRTPPQAQLVPYEGGKSARLCAEDDDEMNDVDSAG